jgi:DNA-binding NtrC family response regulator
LSRLSESVDDHRKWNIKYALSHFGGNRSEAANWLEISRPNLQRYIKKYKLSKEYPPKPGRKS